jgi:hypothetical protein
MQIIKNQILKLFLGIIICLFVQCQAPQNSNSEKTSEASKNQLSIKTASDSIQMNDIWLIQDMDLEKGDVLKAYKVVGLSSDSLKYVKSKINIDTTQSNWQEDLLIQMNYDPNITYRVHKSVKNKWTESKKMIAVYKK